MYSVRVSDYVVCLDRNHSCLSVRNTTPPSARETACKASWTKKRPHDGPSYFVETTKNRHRWSRLPSVVQSVIQHFLREVGCRPESLHLQIHDTVTFMSNEARRWAGFDQLGIKPLTKVGKKLWDSMTTLHSEIEIYERRATLDAFVELGPHVARVAHTALKKARVPGVPAHLEDFVEVLDFMEWIAQFGERFQTPSSERVREITRENADFKEAVQCRAWENDELRAAISKCETFERQSAMLLHDVRRQLSAPDIDFDPKLEAFVAPSPLQNRMASVPGVTVVRVYKNRFYFKTAEAIEHASAFKAAQNELGLVRTELFQAATKPVHFKELLEVVAHIDVALAFCFVMEEVGGCWCAPQVGGHCEFTQLRHFGINECVPSDTAIAKTTLITGFNAAGKSTLLKSIGVAVYLHQLGLYVPASRCTVPIFRRVHVRAGANDALSNGCSTFVAQMFGVAELFDETIGMNLVLIDELGANTNAREGFALAAATINVLRAHGSTTVLATHFRPEAFQELLQGVNALSVTPDHRVAPFDPKFASNGWTYCLKRGFVNGNKTLNERCVRTTILGLDSRMKSIE